MIFIPKIIVEDQGSINRFTTYFNYLKSISDLFDNKYFSSGKYLTEVINSNKFKGIESNKNANCEKAKLLLRNSWFTEIQLNFTESYPELSPYSNHWAMVQMYYSVYLAVRALLFVMNNSAEGSRDHTSTLNAIGNLVGDRHQLFPPPWKITCDGDPNGSVLFSHISKNTIIKSVSSLSSNPRFIDSYTLFLKTTREQILAEKLINKRLELQKKRKTSKKVRLSAAQREEVVAKLPPTTFFDCLYRLRTSANYRDVELFLVGLDRQESAIILNSSIRRITCHTLQAIELLIARSIGKTSFNKFVNDFQKDARATCNNVRNRWEFQENLW